ncbi:MAG: hypothetical protein HOO00_05415 [Rhodospirillaceae bacterium]|nr:hypothetical protein [Rhodospirillaceae bacterium]MBT5373803.1 hypothetical protein [Rhodospirillaceae bacterium]MBT5659051.1 hypothetical protein [Rhodospirillaceae bacterium]
MLNKIKLLLKRINRIGMAAVGYLLLPISGAVFIARLLVNWRRIRRAEIIVIPNQKLNFGNTVIVIDMARRIYAGKNILVLFPQDRGHNPYLARVWSDADVYTFPRFCLSVRFKSRHLLLPERTPHDRMAGALTKFLARILAPQAELIDPVGLREKFNNLDLLPLHLGADVAAWKKEKPNDPMILSVWYSIYNYCISAQDVPPMRLSNLLRDQVRGRLAVARRAGGHETDAKLCVFYSKYAENSIHHLNGSPIDDYIPAFEKIIGRGYQIMLTGDSGRRDDLVQRFKGMVVNEEALSISRDLFNMYAATEADIFVGDNGGGAFLSSINTKHQLVMNSYPFLSSVPNAWIFHMWAHYEDGRPVPYDELATTYASYDPGHNIHVEPNDMDDILAAVEFFLDEIDAPSEGIGGSKLVLEWPTVSLFRMSNSTLSPVYERRLLEKLSQADGASVKSGASGKIAATEG